MPNPMYDVVQQAIANEHVYQRHIRIPCLPFVGLRIDGIEVEQVNVINGLWAVHVFMRSADMGETCYVFTQDGWKKVDDPRA